MSISFGNLAIIDWNVQNDALQRLDRDLHRSMTSFRTSEEQSLRMLFILAQSLAENPAFRGILRRTDRATLLHHLETVQQDFESSLVVVCQAGKVTARTGAESEAEIEKQPALAVAAQGEPTIDYWVLSQGLYRVASVPILGGHDEVEGVVSVAVAMDESKAREMNHDTTAEIVFCTPASILAAYPRLLPENVRPLLDVLGRVRPDLDKTPPKGADEDHVICKVPRGRLTFRGAITPLRDCNGQAVGYLATLRDTAPALKFMEQTRLQLILLGGLSLVLAMFIGGPALARVTRPAEILGAVVVSLGEGLIHLDQNWHVQLINPRAQDLLSTSEEEARGRDLFQLFRLRTDGKDLERAWATATLLRGQPVSEHDGEIRCADGKLFPASFVLTPLLDNRQLTGIVLLFRNISELKAAEEVVQMTYKARETLMESTGEEIVRLAGATQAIAVTADHWEDLAANQVSSTAQVHATAREISNTAEQLVQTIRDVSQVAEDTAGLAVTGHESQEQIHSTLTAIVAAVDDVLLRLSALSEKSEAISKVITTMNTVTGRTNLLAINAAIQAEHAGQFGHGFRVIAEQIRRLSDQNSASTLEIEGIVADLQGAVSSNVQSVNEFTRRMRQGISDVFIVGQQFNRIIDSVLALSPKLAVLHGAVETQSVGAHQISDAMTHLSDSAKKTAESLSDSNRAIQKLNEVVSGLQASVAMFQSMQPGTKSPG